MYFLDTCVCVEFLRGRLRYGYKMMRNSNPKDFRLPSIVVAELWFGAEHSPTADRDLRITEQFVEAFEVAPFDASCAREYGRIRQHLGSQGAIIGDRDLMIAACALANHAILVTDNTREFERVPKLHLESWAEVDLSKLDL